MGRNRTSRLCLAWKTYCVGDLFQGKPIAVDSIGVALEVTNTVAEVKYDSPAQKAGISPGDMLEEAKLVPGAESELRSMDRRAIPLKDESNWPLVHEVVQRIGPMDQVELSYSRDGKKKTATLQPTIAVNWFSADRGINLAPLTEERQVTSLSEATALGWLRTKEGIGHVFVVLRRIRDVHDKLGGPLTIGVVATVEASKSMPQLLLFLTLLSANLAVINFLPIPVLDGGHMMFLLYEGVFRKPVNERVAMGLTMVGFALLMSLMVYVFGLDIQRFMLPT